MTNDAPDRRSEIRTPDQRLRVFVSSTLAELADERAAVARAISSLRLTPVMFELGARPHPPQELYRAYLAQSDIFVGLYWQRYGWVGPGMDISGLEDELRLSVGMPRLMYLKTPAPDQEPRLTEMIAGLQDEATASYRTFRTPRELGRLVRDDLATLLSERFAAASAGRPAPAPDPDPVAGEAERPSTLPATATSLVGRDGDIGAVAGLLESDGVRLVTLTGAGGIGKTRLAIAVAEHVDGRHDRRAVFVPLASVEDVDQVLPRIAAVVGATVEGTRRPHDVLVEHFAAAPTLLVLDNLEQVVGVAPELDALLAASSGLQILATSRTVLRLRAEREYPVAALEVPDAAGLDELAASPAVQLFVDRAQAVRYDFELTAATAAAVAEICRRLDGLPLAIELAAARTRLLDPVALLARLEHVLDGLGAGPVDLPERQRTLRATVEWSIGLLDDAERRMLAALAVFVDGWTIAAAVHVAGLDEDRTLDLLDALAGHSLVNVVATGGEPRFRMLVSVHELAAELLAADPACEDVRRRHAEHFAGLVEPTPGGRQIDWAARLRADEENLHAAVRWFFDHDVTPLPHLFRALWLYWQMGDRMADGRAWIEELRRGNEIVDDLGRAEVLFTSTVIAVEVGDDDAALAALEVITGLEGRVDDPQLASALQLAVAWTLPIVEDFDGALRAASAALAGFREQNEPFVAFAALTVGMLEMTLGHDERARTYLTEVDELGSRFGNNWLESSGRTQLAALAVRAGDLDRARSLLAESVRAGAGVPHSTLTVTFTLVAFAQLALTDGQTRTAATALGAAAGLRQQAGLRTWPLARRTEADLIAQVEQACDVVTYRDAFASGSELNTRDALTLIADYVA